MSHLLQSMTEASLNVTEAYFECDKGFVSIQGLPDRGSLEYKRGLLEYDRGLLEYERDLSVQ